MTTAAEMIRSAQNTIARSFAATTVKIATYGAASYANDLSVTTTLTSCTVACSYPRGATADDAKGDAVLQGMAYVLVNRADSSLTIEPQAGMIAEVLGEQYRIHKADYLPGAVRLWLSGGAAEGVAGS